MAGCPWRSRTHAPLRCSPRLVTFPPTTGHVGVVRRSVSVHWRTPLAPPALINLNATAWGTVSPKVGVDGRSVRPSARRQRQENNRGAAEVVVAGKTNSQSNRIKSATCDLLPDQSSAQRWFSRDSRSSRSRERGPALFFNGVTSSLPGADRWIDGVPRGPRWLFTCVCSCAAAAELS